MKQNPNSQEKIKENKNDQNDEEFIKLENKNDKKDPIDSDKKLKKNTKLKFMKIVMFSPENVRLQHYEKQSIELRKLKRVILHFHGGGFICMSYKSHQRYLRYRISSLGFNLNIISPIQIETTINLKEIL